MDWFITCVSFWNLFGWHVPVWTQNLYYVIQWLVDTLARLYNSKTSRARLLDLLIVEWEFHLEGQIGESRRDLDLPSVWTYETSCKIEAG